MEQIKEKIEMIGKIHVETKQYYFVEYIAKNKHDSYPKTFYDLTRYSSFLFTDQDLLTVIERESIGVLTNIIITNVVVISKEDYEAWKK